MDKQEATDRVEQCRQFVLLCARFLDEWKAIQFAGGGSVRKQQIVWEYNEAALRMGLLQVNEIRPAAAWNDAWALYYLLSVPGAASEVLASESQMELECDGLISLEEIAAFNQRPAPKTIQNFLSALRSDGKFAPIGTKVGRRTKYRYSELLPILRAEWGDQEWPESANELKRQSPKVSSWEGPGQDAG